MWDRHHEVAPGISDQTLNSAFIVTLARATITIVDEVMRQEPAEQFGPLARSVRQDLRNKAPIVIVEN
jgi:hypothetical protein